MLLTVRPKDSAASLVTLLFASGTLLCCALPILLVTVGLGATVASITSALPWLVALGRFKMWTFMLSGAVLASTAWWIYRPGRACPADPQLAALCLRADRWNRVIFWAAVVLYAIGFFAAYLLLPLRQLIGI